MKHLPTPFPFVLVPIAVLVAFAAPATAQLTKLNTRLIHPLVPGLAYTQAGSGDFDGDANVDIAYLCGNQLGVMIAPAIYEVTMNNIAPANDFAVVSTHTTARILTVSNAIGLQEWRMGKAPLFAEPDPNPPTWVWNAESAGTTAWIGANFVRTWSVDAASTYVVALNSAGTALLALQRSETGGPPTWTTSWTVVASVPLSTNNIPNPGDVVDIVPFNFNGTGAPEVAVVRQNLLEIYRPFDAVQPAPVSTVQGLSGYSNTAVTCIRHAGRTHEWLGWVLTQNLDGVTQKFMTYGVDGWKNVVYIGSSLQVFTMLAGRVDADEDDDLIVGHRSELGVIYVPNTGVSGDAPKFSILNFQDMPAIPGASAPSNQARLYIADLDGDGDGDCGFPVRDEDEMWIGWGSSLSSVISQPSLSSHVATPYTVEVAANLIDAEDLNRINFEINSPPFPGNAPAGPRYLEVRLYSMRYDQYSQTNYVEPTAFSTERIVVSGSGSPGNLFVRDVLGAQSIVSGAPGFDRVVYITAQCVVAANTTSNPTWAGPCMMAIVQGQDNANTFDIERPFPFLANRTFVEDQIAQGGLGWLFEVEDQSIHNLTVLPAHGASVGNGGYVPCIPVRPERPPRQ